MEPLFTNTCELTRESYQDALYSLFKRTRTVKILLSFVMCILTFSYGTYYNEYIFIVFSLIFLLLPVYKYWFRIINYAKSLSERNMVIYHKEPVQTFRFFDEYVETIIQPSKGEATLYYYDIIRVEASKKLYTILFKGKSIAFLDKNKFENINLIEFEHFIREKAVNAKVIL